MMHMFSTEISLWLPIVALFAEDTDDDEYYTDDRIESTLTDEDDPGVEWRDDGEDFET